MEVITSHINLDFDGFASMLAANKLYPDAKLVLPNVVSKDVRNFLTLYRSFLEVKEFREIDITKITKIIIVDTSAYNRVIDFAKVFENKEIEVVVYDHHTEEDSVISGKHVEVRKLGACTSMLINKIVEKGIKLRPLESTIMAMGIYSDTNCLTFSSTTVEDAKAVTHLLECGAYLDVISNFVGQPLSIKQQEAFELIMKNIQPHLIKGLEVGVAAVFFDEYIDEIAYLTHKILSLKDYDAVFSIVCIKNRTYIVGRSTVQEVNIDLIMKEFNGGGHLKAGSALVKSQNLYEIRDKLVEVLHKVIEPSISAKNIMSYPVKTIHEDVPLKEVNKIMLRYGHTGIPVVREEKIIGMITRRDVEKAVHHGYGHSPVKAYMSKHLIYVTPDTPLKEIQHKMIENNIGRLPVIEHDKAIGIVTRTDILRQIFGEETLTKHKQLFVDNGNIKFKKNFSREIAKLSIEVQDLLRIVGKVGEEHNSNVYVVGGFVRDLLLGYDNLDIDIVVDGDGIHIAKEVAKRHNGKITVHKNFQTSVVEIGQYKLDIVTARREFYEYPAALPTVERGSIYSDLYRRDFTINSMAISINPKNFGNIYDFFGGQRDLQQELVRVLYNMSFIEDPTRIFRAIRFEQRYGFKLEEQTKEFLVRALDSNALDNVSDERISNEIMLVLEEKNAGKAIIRMVELGLLNKLYPQIDVDQTIIALLNEIKFVEKNYNDYLIYLLILFSRTEYTKAHEVLNKLKLKRQFRSEILGFTKLRDTVIESFSKRNINNYEIYTCLNGLSNEAINVIRLVCDNDRVREKIDFYMAKLREIKPLIDGSHLKNLGLKGGPFFKEVLQKVFEEKLENRLNSLQDEIDYVRKMIDERV